MFLLWVRFVIYVSCLSLVCCLVCSLQPCNHLLGKGLRLLCVMFSYAHCVPDQVWYLIVLIPGSLPSSLLINDYINREDPMRRDH